MRRIEMMTAGGVTLGGLGVLVGLAIGSGTGTPKIVAQRAQPIEVRTEVIRKTVNVYKRAKPPHVSAAGPGGKRGATSSAVYGRGSAAPTTRASGIKSAGTGSYAAAPVATRTSGAKSTSGSSSQGSGSGTVKTRTSGGAASGGGSGSAKPVSTRSSGGGGSDNGGGHDD
jgi:hypothetical protein